MVARPLGIIVYCKESDCEKPIQARGWCSMHYRRWRLNGDPQIVKVIRDDPEAAFWSHVEKDPKSGCWLWIGRVNSTGYGEIQRDGRKQRAHVWAYEYFVGKIPENMQIDHVKAAGCINKNCVNYENHLEVVTQYENFSRSDGIARINRDKTHCKRGHAFTEENTIIKINSRTGKTYRNCRECRNISQRKDTVH